MLKANKKSVVVFTVLAIVVIPVAHYTSVIHDARAHTQSYVEDAYAKQENHVELSILAPERLDMLLQIEDPLFFNHKGVDLETPGAGLTTITQGLVKQLYFPDGFKPGIAKIRQTLIARYALDSLVSKEEQLKLFLNIAYFGSHERKPIYGFNEASKIYYKRDLPQLTDTEFLSLVAMLIGPNALRPGTENNAHRVKLMQAFLDDEIEPANLLDVTYEGKRRARLVELAAMTLLRAIT